MSDPVVWMDGSVVSFRWRGYGDKGVRETYWRFRVFFRGNRLGVMSCSKLIFTQMILGGKGYICSIFVLGHWYGWLDQIGLSTRFEIKTKILVVLGPKEGLGLF